jgi:hypothetical protein
MRPKLQPEKYLPKVWEIKTQTIESCLVNGLMTPSMVISEAQDLLTRHGLPDDLKDRLNRLIAQASIDSGSIH